MPLIDTHAHIQINAFDADRVDVLERACAAGVGRIITVGYDLPSSQASVALAAEYPQIYATAGIQPHYAQETSAAQLAELEALLQQPKVAALGEIGLDYHHHRAPREAQHDLFRTQLAIARAYELPVVIHSREAQADTVRILSESAQGMLIVMHAFSGDWSYATACLELGAYISFAGPVTFPKATSLHEVAQRAPLDRILIETDCPYLSPHPFRGKRNEPAHVRLVAERIAALRRIRVDDMIEAIWANAQRAFARLG
jgi:TatD DNase family protein